MSLAECTVMCWEAYNVELKGERLRESSEQRERL